MKKNRTLLTIVPAMLLIASITSCGGAKKVTIKFNTDGGGTIADITFDSNGGKINRPNLIPHKEKHHFVDWLVGDKTNPSFFNFNKEIKENTNIFAYYVTNDLEVSKAEWETSFNRFKFDVSTSYSFTLKNDTSTIGTIKKLKNKLTYTPNGLTAIPFYIDNNGNLWSEEETTPGSNEYRYVVSDQQYLNGVRNAFKVFENAYDDAYFDGSGTYYIVSPLGGGSSVSFKEVELSNGEKTKTIDKINDFKFDDVSFAEPTLEDVFHEIKTDNRYYNFNFNNNTWNIDKSYSVINNGDKQYFVINVDKDCKNATFMTITVDGKTPKSDDCDIKVYYNYNSKTLKNFEDIGFSDQEYFKNTFFAVEITAKKELKNINISLNTEDIIIDNSTNGLDYEEAYIKYLDDSTLFYMGLSKISKTEQDAIARQPETAYKVHYLANLGRKGITDNKVSGLQSYSIGKSISSACEALARQPEVFGAIINAATFVINQTVCNSKEVAIGYGGVGSNLFDAIARQPESKHNMMYAYLTIFAPSIGICGSFDKAFAIGATGANTMDAIARQPEVAGKLGYCAKVAVEEILNY